ncbi:MAG: hypothetical protein LUD82_06955 [Clostridiales bacterium]|nr:hypothetical protein [Clostridiales bacterium]
MVLSSSGDTKACASETGNADTVIAMRNASRDPQALPFMGRAFPCPPRLVRVQRRCQWAVINRNVCLWKHEGSALSIGVRPNYCKIT